jgi:hypothetical protein
LHHNQYSKHQNLSVMSFGFEQMESLGCPMSKSQHSKIRPAIKRDVEEQYPSASCAIGGLPAQNEESSISPFIWDFSKEVTGDSQSAMGDSQPPTANEKGLFEPIFCHLFVPGFKRRRDVTFGAQNTHLPLPAGTSRSLKQLRRGNKASSANIRT